MCCVEKHRAAGEVTEMLQQSIFSRAEVNRRTTRNISVTSPGGQWNGPR